MTRQLRRQAQRKGSGVAYAHGEKLVREVAQEARAISTERGIAAALLMTGVNTYYNTVSALSLNTKPPAQIKTDIHTTLEEMGEAMLTWLGIHSQDQEDEITRLKARIAELEAAQPKENPMPEPTPQTPDLTKLEQMSLCAFLKAQGIPAKVTATGLDHGGQMTDAHVAAWRAEHPDEDAMLRQLRAIVRPIAGRAA